MLLAVDCGNTNIVFCGIDDKKIYFESRIITDKTVSCEEYTEKIKKLEIGEIEGVVLSSVVPDLTEKLEKALRLATKKEVKVVNPEINHGLTIKIDNEKELGSDLLVSVVGALREYKPPFVIVDMGTATTITAVNGKAEILGVSILPGVRISFDALKGVATHLPSIPLEAPKNVIGKNTVDSLKSGLIFGSAAMIDGIVERMEEEMGEKLRIIATGGISGHIVKNCKREVVSDNALIIKGLYELYVRENKNR